LDSPERLFPLVVGLNDDDAFCAMAEYFIIIVSAAMRE
jgi:hypothetical protein